MHLPPLIQDLAIILGLAGAASLLFQKIKQPVILGYLIVGILTGPYTPPFSFVIDIPNLKIWADLGVIFMMFQLGFDFKVRHLFSLGKTPLLTGFCEPLLMLAFGYGVGHCLNWDNRNALYLGGITAISSTTVIMRSFYELQMKQSAVANLVFGTLIIEDIMGVLLLVVFSSMATHDDAILRTILLSVIKLVVTLVVWLFIGRFILGRLIDFIAKKSTNEVILLVSIALCLAFAVASSYLHLSMAMGAFFMGVTIAETEALPKIRRLTAPITDIFSAIFFVSIGMLLDPKQLLYNWKIVCIMTVVIIVGKVIATTFGAKVSGQKLSTALAMGLSMSQIGEFSFIIVGFTDGSIKPALYPIAISVAVITTFITPYLMRRSKALVQEI